MARGGGDELHAPIHLLTRGARTLPRSHSPRRKETLRNGSCAAGTDEDQCWKLLCALTELYAAALAVFLPFIQQINCFHCSGGKKNNQPTTPSCELSVKIACSQSLASLRSLLL